MSVPAYPLTWPTGWKRIPHHQRKAATFKSSRRALSVFEGVTRVREELGRLGVGDADLVISTNLETRMDGWPRSDRAEPGDPGVAVYWRKDSQSFCMATDRYDRVADNLAAIAATLDAMRAIERHGGAEILNRTFTGFTALPPPLDWRRILGFAAGEKPLLGEVDLAYRRRASKLHPDKGGFADDMANLNAARDVAREELL